MKPKDVKKKGRPEKKGGTDKFISKYIFLSFIFLLITSCSEKGPDQRHLSENKIEQDTQSVKDTILTIVNKSDLELYLDSLGLIDIQLYDSTIYVDLKYSTTENFTGNILYKNLNRGYLHVVAMTKLSKAQSLLKEKYPEFSLLVYDAARPVSVQQEMYDAVKDTPYKAYVANPERTSLHNYGLAVDLTICDKNKVPLDMGTEFDFFGAKAGINQEDSLIARGLLTEQQVKNRRLLRNIMQEAGFTPIRGEWWHFNACSLAEAKRVARIL